MMQMQASLFDSHKLWRTAFRPIIIGFDKQFMVDGSGYYQFSGITRIISLIVEP